MKRIEIDIKPRNTRSLLEQKDPIHTSTHVDLVNSGTHLPPRSSMAAQLHQRMVVAGISRNLVVAAELAGITSEPAYAGGGARGTGGGGARVSPEKSGPSPMATRSRCGRYGAGRGRAEARDVHHTSPMATGVRYGRGELVWRSLRGQSFPSLRGPTGIQYLYRWMVYFEKIAYIPNVGTGARILVTSNPTGACNIAPAMHV